MCPLCWLRPGPLHFLFRALSILLLLFPGAAIQLREQSPRGCRRKLVPELPPLPGTCPQPLPRASHLSPSPEKQKQEENGQGRSGEDRDKAWRTDRSN